MDFITKFLNKQLKNIQIEKKNKKFKCDYVKTESFYMLKLRKYFSFKYKRC